LVAVLDTCVLFPAALRDTLLRAAEHRLYIGRWSEAILEELVRNLVAHGGVAPARAETLRTTIRGAFPNALVAGYEHRIPELTNHPGDRHVLAAAVHVGAQVIVTSNLRDFPQRALAPYGIMAQSPDDFLCTLLDQFPVEMTMIISRQAADLKKMPKTQKDVLFTVGLLAPRFARRMRHLAQGSSQ